MVLLADNNDAAEGPRHVAALDFYDEAGFGGPEQRQRTELCSAIGTLDGADLLDHAACHRLFDGIAALSRAIDRKYVTGVLARASYFTNRRPLSSHASVDAHRAGPPERELMGAALLAMFLPVPAVPAVPVPAVPVPQVWEDSVTHERIRSLHHLTTVTHMSGAASACARPPVSTELGVPFTSRVQHIAVVPAAAVTEPGHAASVHDAHHRAKAALDSDIVKLDAADLLDVPCFFGLLHRLEGVSDRVMRASLLRTLAGTKYVRNGAPDRVGRKRSKAYRATEPERAALRHAVETCYPRRPST